MIYYLIVCRSLTYAQRTAKILEGSGISGIVTKAPQGVSDGGCTYCVKVSEKRLSAALVALKAAGANPGTIYILQNDGSCEVVK